MNIKKYILNLTSIFILFASINAFAEIQGEACKKEKVKYSTAITLNSYIELNRKEDSCDRYGKLDMIILPNFTYYAEFEAVNHEGIFCHGVRKNEGRKYNGLVGTNDLGKLVLNSLGTLSPANDENKMKYIFKFENELASELMFENNIKMHGLFDQNYIEVEKLTCK